MTTTEKIQDQLDKFLGEAKEAAIQEHPVPLFHQTEITESELHKLTEDKTAHMVTKTIRFSTWGELWKKLKEIVCLSI